MSGFRGAGLQFMLELYDYVLKNPKRTTNNKP